MCQKEKKVDLVNVQKCFTSSHMLHLTFACLQYTEVFLKYNRMFSCRDIFNDWVKVRKMYSYADSLLQLKL